MGDGELGRIEKPAAVQSVKRDEISPFLASVGKVEAGTGGAKRPVRSRDGAMGSGNAETRPCGSDNHDAGLDTELGGRCPGNDFQRIDRIDRNLVGKNLALLIGDGLAINGE